MADNPTESKVDPFHTVTAVCPGCREESQQRKLKTGVYSDDEKDLDLRSVSVKWHREVTKKVVPRYFGHWTCPNCHFVADISFWQHIFDDDVLHPAKLQKQYQDFLRKSDYTEVRNILELEGYSNKSSFMKSFKETASTIYILQHLEAIEKAECLALAKNWIRVAWLFRDLENNKSLRKKYQKTFTTAVAALKGVWSDWSVNEEEALEKSLNYYTASIVQSRSVDTAAIEMNIHVIRARIFLQLGSFDDAKKILVTTKTRVNQMEQSIIAQENKKSVPLAESKIALADVGRARGVLTAFENLYERLEMELIESQLDEARKLLADQDLSAEEIEVFGKSKNYHSDTIAKLIAENKKSIFGF